MRRSGLASITLISITLMVLALAACSASVHMSIESDGGTYAIEEIEGVARTVERPGVVGSPVSDAEDLRHDALVSARSQGEQGAELADLLGRVFPPDSRAVPYYAELATVDGRPAWIVVEVWGVEAGALDNFRVWVLERERGDVILSTVFE